MLISPLRCVLAVMRSGKRFAIDRHLRGALPYHLRPPTGHSNGGPFEDSPSSCHYLLEILSAQKLEQRQEQRRAQEQRPGAAAMALAGARRSWRQRKKAAELEAKAPGKGSRQTGSRAGRAGQVFRRFSEPKQARLSVRPDLALSGSDFHQLAVLIG